MPKMIDGDDGAQIEVYTADEVAAARTEAATAKEGELAPKLSQAEKDLAEARKAAADRAGEFAQFRKLSDEQVAALTEKDRIIYQNGLALKESEDKRIAAETTSKETAVKAVIKAKAGTNAALEAKMAEMWPLIAVDATTPDEIEAKAKMVLGAISTTQPDLMAGVAGFSGAYAPPVTTTKEGETFADTPQGKAAAEFLGLKTAPPKQS